MFVCVCVCACVWKESKRARERACTFYLHAYTINTRIYNLEYPVSERGLRGAYVKAAYFRAVRAAFFSAYVKAAQQIIVLEQQGSEARKSFEALLMTLRRTHTETYRETVREAELEKSGATEASALLQRQNMQSQNTATRGQPPPHASSPPPLASEATSPTSSPSTHRSSGEADENRKTLSETMSETQNPHSRPDSTEVEGDGSLVLGRRFSSFGTPEFSIANKFLGVSDFEFVCSKALF